MICKSCGAPLPDDALKCEFCGTPTGRGEANINRAGELPTIQRSSALGVFALLIITFGIYSPFWYVSRARRLRAADEINNKSLLAYAEIYLILIAGFYFTILASPDIGADGYEPYRIAGSWLIIASAVMAVWLAFATRRALVRHASKFQSAASADVTVGASWLELILLGPAYLQGQINKLIKLKYFGIEI